MDRLVVVKFHTNIANRWLFMRQRKIMAIILYSKVIWTCLGGPFFPDTVYKVPKMVRLFLHVNISENLSTCCILLFDQKVKR